MFVVLSKASQVLLNNFITTSLDTHTLLINKILGFFYIVYSEVMYIKLMPEELQNKNKIHKY